MIKTPQPGGDALGAGSDARAVSRSWLLENVIKIHVQLCLAEHDGDRIKTAKALGIGKTTLYHWLKIWGITGILLVAASAAAQSSTTVALQLITEAADAGATYRNATNRNFQEHNPIARPFVTHGLPLFVGYFALDAGAKIGAAYWCKKHHHETLGRVIAWVGIANSAAMATQSFVGYKP